MGNVHRFLEDLPARASSSSPPTYTEPSLFLYGSRARYVTPELRPEIEQYFPRAEMRALDAGHWVHAEKPTEFVDVVGEFLTREMDD